MTTIKECLDNFDECYLICFKGEDYIISEIQLAENYLGGEGLDGYMNDWGVHFKTSGEAETFYRQYDKVLAFDEEFLRDEREPEEA